MLREIIERSAGRISDAELQEILDLTTTDIKTNRIGYGQRTSLEDAVGIAQICYTVIQR